MHVISRSQVMAACRWFDGSYRFSVLMGIDSDSCRCRMQLILGEFVGASGSSLVSNTQLRKRWHDDQVCTHRSFYTALNGSNLIVRSLTGEALALLITANTGSTYMDMAEREEACRLSFRHTTRFDWRYPSPCFRREISCPVRRCFAALAHYSRLEG